MYVEPTLYYAATVWSPHILHSINKVESVQKRATCFIVKDYRRTSSIIQIFNSLSLKSISYLHVTLRCNYWCFIKLCTSWWSSPYLTNLIEEMNIILFCYKPLLILYKYNFSQINKMEKISSMQCLHSYLIFVLFFFQSFFQWILSHGNLKILQLYSICEFYN